MDLAERVSQALGTLDAQQARIEALRANLEKAVGEIEAFFPRNSFSPTQIPISQGKPNGRGNLHGTGEKQCANSLCTRKFLPRNGRQKFCSRNCARSVWERQRAPRKVGEKAADAAVPCTD
jgi:hypothetical protein